jgi:hypothetical protein
MKIRVWISGVIVGLAMLLIQQGLFVPQKAPNEGPGVTVTGRQ